jgi:hypothetical protein
MQQSSSPAPDLEKSYGDFLLLWTSGIRDFQTLLSGYLTANSIFVAAIGFLVAREPATKVFYTFIFVLCVFGVLISLQMAIVLGRFDAQNAFWEWRLRGIERFPGWSRLTPFEDFFNLKDKKQVLSDPRNIPPTFQPSWPLRVHRQWWAHRAVSFPLFFGITYSIFRCGAWHSYSGNLLAPRSLTAGRGHFIGLTFIL